ncbi:SLC13 family permease [uncultured Catenibacterium sp.]|uniref:SLC13 family permease n=1 Tax=uncultured Catenibacterium sp. TaxID=286142 RepID=UPI0025E4877A|nr:SLC13 family permease [uncultured Catenibacterium sp.]
MKLNKNSIGLIGALLILSTAVLLPDHIGLGVIPNRTLGILLAFLCLLITEALPIIIISLLICALMPVLKVTDQSKTSFIGFSEPVIFFVVASFGIAAALTVIPVAQRILRKLLKLFGKNIENVVLALMIACALMSSVISNIPTCAIFMAIAIKFLDIYENEEDKRKTGRALMIAIPVSSMIGGMMTPAGSSINILAMAQLEKYTGLTITFVEWMKFGVPIACIMIPISWFIFVKIYRPSQVSEESIKQFIYHLDIPDKMDVREYIVLIIVGGMLVLWILSSWIHDINIIVVAIIGCSLLFLPGINILDAKTFVRENSWDAFFLVGALTSVCHMLFENGIIQSITNSIPPLTSSIVVLSGICAVFIFGLLLIIPVATALVPLVIPIFITIAIGSGVSPIAVTITASLCACNCYLFPLDTVPLLTYSKGYYSMIDMAKATWLLQVIMVILCMVWLPLAIMI